MQNQTIFSIRKTTVAVVSVAIATFGVATVNPAQASEVEAVVETTQVATEQIVGYENVEVVTPAMEQAQAEQAALVEDVKSAGVDVWNNDPIEVQSEAEALAQIAKDNARLEAAKAEQARLDAEHAAALEEYNKAVEDQASKTTEEAQPSEVVVQTLDWGKDAGSNTEVRVNTGEVAREEVVEYVKTLEAPDFSTHYIRDNILATDDFAGTGKFVELTQGPVSVSYKAPENIYVKGEKVTWINMEFRLVEMEKDTKLYAKIFDEIGKGIWTFGYNSSNRIRVRISAYGTNGKISLAGTAWNFGSLNNDDNGYEYAVNRHGKFVTINGSTITNNDGKAYSLNENNARDLGVEWDDPNLETAYLGAIVAIAGGESFEFEFGNVNRSSQWFTINGDIPVKDLPVYPRHDRAHTCITPVILKETRPIKAIIPNTPIETPKTPVEEQKETPETPSEKPQTPPTSTEIPVVPTVETPAKAAEKAPESVSEVFQEVSQGTLPQTGTKSGHFLIGLAVLSVAGAVFTYKKKD